MLTPAQVQLLKEELKTAKNPLFIHDDDADGLCSYLVLYHIHREGRNFIPKNGKKLDAGYLKYIQEMNPDKIFVLDIHDIDQEFLDKIKRPVFWIDHHEPKERTNVHYFNPKIKDPDSYFPTTRMAYQVSENPDDLWIATAGCLADYHLPDFIDEFRARYPWLLKKKRNLPETIYKEKVGQLVKLFFFMLKGPTSEVKESLKNLRKVKDVSEIFNKTTPEGAQLCERFERLNGYYENLLKDVRKKATRSDVLLYEYTDSQWSFTANLANELTILYPKKVIIISRKKGDDYKCSLRAQFPIAGAVEKALVGVQGYGGGHPNACGAVIKEESWNLFLKQFKEEVKKLKR